MDQHPGPSSSEGYSTKIEVIVFRTKTDCSENPMHHHPANQNLLIRRRADAANTAAAHGYGPRLSKTKVTHASLPQQGPSRLFADQLTGGLKEGSWYSPSPQLLLHSSGSG